MATPLERLFLSEVEYHRKLRCDAPGTADATSLHTSYALQGGYEGLILASGRVTAKEVAAMMKRLTLAGDPRDVLRARDSVMAILGIRQFDA